MTRCTLLLAGLLLLPGVAAQAQTETGAEDSLRTTNTVRVLQQVGPAVVNVYQEGVQEVELPWPYNRLYGPQRTRRSSLGSGFIIDEDGYILTNGHVIPLGSEGIQVRLADDTTYEATLISVDSENDVALLQIQPEPDRQLAVARLGTSSDLMVGEPVIAIGNPLGYANSVSTGIVSSLFRDVPLATGTGRGGRSTSFKDFIQVDAPINPGNSGGPLLNALGEVIGINFAIATEAEGIGFAIPIDRVRRSLLDNLLNPRLRREVVTGFEVAGGPDGRDVVVSDLTPDGPAARAGLREGDRLLAVRNTPITWEFDYNKALLDARPGERVSILVQRGSRTLEAELELAHNESPLLAIWRRLGLAVVDHPKFKGVRVQRVDPTGPGASLGLESGDLIDGIGDQLIDNTQQLYDAFRELPPDRRITVHVWRGREASSGPLTLR
jgi:serine protease Do